MDNDYPGFGWDGSRRQPYFTGQQLFATLDQFNLGMSSHMTCEREAQMTGMDPSQPDVLEVPCPVGRKPTKEKKVSRRGGGFTKEEDRVVCSAFLNVSKDPITGVNQSQGGYYKRLHAYYNAHKPEGSNRSQLAIQGRWLTIQRAVNKFCGFKASIDRRNKSGKNEQDRIEDAIKIYEQVEPFHFMHCWKILRDQPKRNEKILEINNSDASKGAATSVRNTSPLGSEGQSQPV